MFMKKHLLILLLLFVGLMGYAQATLSGKTTDDKGEPVPSVTVAVIKNGVPKYYGQSDFDGLYRITNIDVGTYDVEFRIIGSGTQLQKGVKLFSGVATLNQVMSDDPKLLDVVTIKEYKVPIVKVDQTSTGGALTSEQIARLPTKDISGLMAAAAPGIAVDANGKINVKGSRDNANDYYIDGIRVRGTNLIPASEIEQLEVITGGLQARYGDVIGSVTNITTKGPASKLSGGIEVETSKYLDNFGYNFVNANLAGPLLRKTRTDKSGSSYKETILGFRLSGQMRTNEDANPSAIPVYRVKEDALKALEANPLATIGGGAKVAAAELLGRESFDAVAQRPFNKRAQYDFVGKIDARLSKAIDIAFTGNYYKIADQTTPDSNDDGTATSTGGNWQVFNSHNNPTEYTDRFRTNLRFRHRLGNTEGPAGKDNKGTTFENAQYTLQFGFERNFDKISDPRHEGRLFDYGYVGQFNYVNTPVVVGVFDQATRQVTQTHLGYARELNGYKRSEINPVLSNYNNGSDIDASGNNVNVFNGFYNRENQARVWNFHQNVGNVYNRFRKRDGSLITGTANISFDFLPGGDKSKAHNIQIGATYEQRDDRSYSIRPFSLWNIAEQLQDGIINGTALDTTRVLRDSLVAGQSVKIYAPLKNKEIASQLDIQFYKRYREKFGLAPVSFGNVNNLTPDQMSLDLFTARELNDKGITGYYGYDYLGNRLESNVSFNDFFKSKDITGTRSFPVAPFRPVYLAGYIQDKFRYKDIIFSMGVRVDRFDANTKVLKDPYSLYDIFTAKDYYDNILKTEKPSNIGDDWKVYVNSYTNRPSDNINSIQAYRLGEQWYGKNGQPFDPVTLFGENGQTYARYKMGVAGVDFGGIKELRFEPEQTFEDYKPQTNIMPRLAFSFPISDVANFFAHYDVLVARPSSDTRGPLNYVSALDYFYFDDVNRTPERNSNLKPERTIDYEIGFQQKLNESSGLKIASFYKEMRDMIQLRFYKYLPAPLKISEYASYDNVDFGTVKGFTFQYDLRPTGHVSANINYTLQFADGTGSDAASQRGLNRRGNIRTLSPLNYDERHRVVATIDYRFEGKYDGPTLFGSEIFKNAGANIQVSTVSGRPFTKRVQPVPFDGTILEGGINGNRLPWIFNIDLRIDKTISISKNPKNPLDMNIYLRVQNLLDTRNIAQVYNASGSPDDDGYLRSTRGQSELANIEVSRKGSVDAYFNSYQMRMLDPDFYYLPRRIFLGATFSF
jgi:Carboxypeptidase regulatory-like domain/TonB-dependent Receptor Plug Domain